MKKTLVTALCYLGLSAAVGPVFAEDADPDLCLDCHVPAEDWEGMSAEEILADARDIDIARHAANADLSEEQLRQMIAKLLSE